MPDNHITYFKVENFKRFNSLEVNDIGQFNLIVGDNNVGKTCLLEALLFDEKDKELTKVNYLKSLYNRKIFDADFYEDREPFQKIKLNHLSRKNKSTIWLINNEKIEIDFNKLSIDIKQRDLDYSLRRVFNFSDGKTNQFIKILLKEWFFIFINEKFNYPLVSFNINSEDDILNLYNKLTTKSDKENLIKTIKIIFPTILNVEYKIEFEEIKDTFIFSFEDKNEFIPLNYLGDGFKRIFYIILKILSLRGKRILIDEIEIGIHYSKIEEFWINIMKVCSELNVQLFATTHSKECIEAFVEASEKVKLEKIKEDIRLIEIEAYTNTEGIEKTITQTHNYERMKFYIQNGSDRRG